MAERILGPVLEKRFGAEPTSITSEDLRSAVVASGSSFPSHVKDEDIITAVENLSTDELSPIVASEDASDAGGPAAGSPRRLLLSVQKKATGGAAASSADAKRQRAGKLRGKVTVRISSGSILTSLTRVYHGASRCALLDSAGGLWDDCADCSDDRASYRIAPKGKFMIATDPSVERAEKDGEGIHLTVVIAEQRPATDDLLECNLTFFSWLSSASSYWTSNKRPPPAALTFIIFAVCHSPLAEGSRSSDPIRMSWIVVQKSSTSSPTLSVAMS
jgi:hypothetical protein